MVVHVEMSSDEFKEFISWRSDKDMYERDLQKMDGKLEYAFNKVLWSLDVDEKRPGKVKIIDQEHASELVEMAKDWFC